MSFPYVLKLGGNNPTFTKILHYWFDLLQYPPPKGKANWQALGGSFTKESQEMVTQFQVRYGLKPPPKRPFGEVRAAEWQQLGRLVGIKVWDPQLDACIEKGTGCPPPLEIIRFFNSIGGFQGNVLSGGINVYGPRFLSMYAEEFGGLDASALTGLGQFLNFMRSDKNLTDIRYAAYLMATVYKESWYSWQPIDEKGKGAGKKYGLPRTGTCGGKTYSRVYYGRGYIQITWEDNYQLADRELGLNCSLVANPERAKEPEIAYKIASNGMKDGWFDPSSTHYKLSDFISGNTCDYYNARKIVNMNDKKTYSEIESYAKTFEVMLRACMFR